MTNRIHKPKIVFISGNMAAGKSSVAQALAEKFPKSVHVRGDTFRRMIVCGQAEMGSTLSIEASQQLLLRYQLTANTVKKYYEAGFDIVVQDIVIGKGLVDVLALYQELPLYLVMLCPNVEVIAERDRSRSKTGYVNEQMVHDFDRILKEETPKFGFWLDNSDLTIKETVDKILLNLSNRYFT